MTGPLGEPLADLLDLELDLRCVSLVAQRDYLLALMQEQDQTPKYDVLIEQITTELVRMAEHREQRLQLAQAINEAICTDDCSEDDVS